MEGSAIFWSIRAWEAGEDETLISLFKAGETYLTISRTLTNRTREAVGGRVARLRQLGRLPWPNVDGTAKVAARRADRRTVARKIPKSVKDVEPPRERVTQVEALTLETGAHVTMAELRDGMCKYGHGEVGTQGFHFCGQKTEQGSSWCPFHETKVFNLGAAKRISADPRARAAEATRKWRNDRIFA